MRIIQPSPTKIWIYIGGIMSVKTAWVMVGLCVLPKKLLACVRCCTLPGVLIALYLSPALAVSGYLDIKVRDAATGYAVPALVKGDGPELFSTLADKAGHLRRSLAPGEYRFEVSWPGYQDFKSYTTIEGGKTVSMTLMLQPVNPTEEEGLLEAKLREGFTLFHGYAVDKETGQPVSDVRVRLQRADKATITDHRGYYWLSVPTPPETEPDVPGTDTLIAEKPGWKTIVHRNMLIGGEDGGGYHLDLERGTGTVERDDTHKLMHKKPLAESKAQPTGSAPTVSAELYQWLGVTGKPFLIGSQAKSVVSSPNVITIPASIRVGTNCVPVTCKTCCTTVTSYSLETYVQIGLGEEWIPDHPPCSETSVPGNSKYSDTPVFHHVLMVHAARFGIRGLGDTNPLRDNGGD
jgi:hypothetical protein